MADAAQVARLGQGNATVLYIGTIKMRRELNMPSALVALLLIGTLALSGCGGREAHPISATNATDSILDCGGITREFEANERQILTTLKEQTRAQGKNIILGATGALIFFPALFFMDPKSPEKVEIDALRNRNLVLTQAARAKGCTAPKSQLAEVYQKLDGKGLKPTDKSNNNK